MLGFYQACRWLDAHAGELVEVSLLGLEGPLGPPPLTLVGLLQPGIVGFSEAIGVSFNQFAIGSGNALAGSFWLSEEALVGSITRHYREGSPALDVVMNLHGVLVSLRVRVLEAAAVSRRAEVSGSSDERTVG